MRIVFKDTAQLQKIIAAVQRISTTVNIDFDEHGFTLQAMSDNHLFLSRLVVRSDLFEAFDPPSHAFEAGVNMTNLVPPD